MQLNVCLLRMRRKCASLNTTKWSRQSRRMEPMSLRVANHRFPQNQQFATHAGLFLVSGK